jgi:hypothetical protein
MGEFSINFERERTNLDGIYDETIEVGTDERLTLLLDRWMTMMMMKVTGIL